MDLPRRRRFKVRYGREVGARTRRPYLHGRLSLNGGPEVDVKGLVDSGADFSLIPEHLATALGVDVADHRWVTQGAILAAGVPIRGLRVLESATLLMRPAHVIGLHLEVPIRAAFVPGMDHAVWGRGDFFQSFDVTFQHMKRRFILEPHADPRRR